MQLWCGKNTQRRLLHLHSPNGVEFARGWSAAAPGRRNRIRRQEVLHPLVRLDHLLLPQLHDYLHIKE